MRDTSTMHAVTRHGLDQLFVTSLLGHAWHGVKLVQVSMQGRARIGVKRSWIMT